jgi:hypothetical protein
VDNAKECLKKAQKEGKFYHAPKYVAKIDRKMLDHLNGAYKILHLYGYYDGINVVSVVKDGFDIAYTLIEKIKPAGLNGAAKKCPAHETDYIIK